MTRPRSAEPQLYEKGSLGSRSREVGEARCAGRVYAARGMASLAVVRGQTRADPRTTGGPTGGHHVRREIGQATKLAGTCLTHIRSAQIHLWLDKTRFNLYELGKPASPRSAKARVPLMSWEKPLHLGLQKHECLYNLGKLASSRSAKARVPL
jgi:hypothetical protein